MLNSKEKFKTGVSFIQEVEVTSRVIFKGLRVALNSLETLGHIRRRSFAWLVSYTP